MNVAEYLSIIATLGLLALWEIAGRLKEIRRAIEARLKEPRA